jgi:hypothetical protein
MECSDKISSIETVAIAYEEISRSNPAGPAGESEAGVRAG